MNIDIKGTKIHLSQEPAQNVDGAILVLIAEAKEYHVIDVKRYQKRYDLPEGVTKKDIAALYLRVM